MPVAPSFLNLDDEENRVTSSETRDIHLRVGVSSKPPQLVAAEEEPPLPSRKRSLFAKFLFVMIVIVVLVLAAMEISIVAKVPWLDPRPILLKAWTFVAHKIPWDRLPRLRKF